MVVCSRGSCRHVSAGKAGTGKPRHLVWVEVDLAQPTPGEVIAPCGRPLHLPDLTRGLAISWRQSGWHWRAVVTGHRHGSQNRIFTWRSAVRPEGGTAAIRAFAKAFIGGPLAISGKMPLPPRRSFEPDNADE